jgi:hypothetical protein
LLLASLIISGCSGLQAFSKSVQAGDTVAIAIHRRDIRKPDATIVIRDWTGYEQSFPGNDPRVRGWINVYPDPVSRLVVGRESNEPFATSAAAFGYGLENQTTSGSAVEKDWYETIIQLDLPGDLAVGLATIDVQVAGVSILPQPVSVNILPGAGSPHPYEIFEGAPIADAQFTNMERAPHYTVTFSGTTVPQAIQVDFSHDPDRENGGVGQAYVVNPRGDVNNIAWTDDGVNLRVIILPAWYKTTEDIDAEWFNDRNIGWFKFYVAGKITNLQLTGVSAYDADGGTVSGVSATIETP